MTTRILGTEVRFDAPWALALLAVAAPASVWLLAFSMFAFFSLALLKRHAEVITLPEAHSGLAPGRGYVRGDAALIVVIPSGFERDLMRGRRAPTRYGTLIE